MISVLAPSATAVILWIWAPFLIVALAVLNSFVCFAVQGLHIVMVMLPQRLVRNAAGEDDMGEPFVSIHVATYNEPPGVVMETLRSLSRMTYKNFEVIVLDNNTTDEATWSPVKAACDELGLQFRFFHFDGVKGAKAGALNLCLKIMSKQTEYVAIVDSDYKVEPNFLCLGIKELSNGDVTFVQFPQTYFGTESGAKAVAIELRDYFAAFARRANTTRSMLLTGTLSIIRAEALCAIGGWSHSSITEDAELGVRFFTKGHEGIFIDTVVGHGLLPLTFQSLVTQRHRWVSGNVQSLMNAARHGVFFRRVFGMTSVVAQLTAWPAFWLVPASTLLAATIVSLLDKIGGASFGYAVAGTLSGARSAAILVASFTILISALFIAVRMSLTAFVRGENWEGTAAALAVKLSLVWTSSVAWIEQMMGARPGFVRTPKEYQGNGAIGWPNIVPGVAGLASAVVQFYDKQFIASLACLLIASTAPAAMWVSHSLTKYRCHLPANSLSGDLVFENA